MRVIAGSARSVPLIAPAGFDTRPTTDKIKETLFNMINFDLPDCVFIDLYSGSGAIGIEALSRGAKHAYFVEKNRKAIECIKLNVLKCKFEDRATIISRSASDALYEIHSKADIIFMDPPYDLMEEENIMKQLLTSKILHEDTIIIIEAAMERDLRGIEELGYELYKEKFYKSNKHVFFRLKNDSNL